MSKKVPQLRFNGYSDAWVQRKLGENATILTGGTPKTTEPSYWEPKEIPWMSSGEVNKKRLESTDNMISEIGLENSSARWVKEHSILIALAGQGKTRGMVAINNIPLTTNQSIAAIEPNESLDYEFVFQNLGNRYDELRMSSSGDGTRGGLNKKIISDILVSAPDIDEQKQIGKLFANLDNLIAANQRKLDLLKEQKKGYLQKMFPKNGAKVPELRFAGFADAWVQRKLADVVSISAGGDIDKTKLIEDGGYPVLANALTNSGVVGYYDSYKVEAPAVTVTGRGDVGHAVSRHVNFTPVVRLLSLKSEVLDADFIANMLNQTNILVESTGVPQLTAPQLGSYKILYPNLNEQTKIGKLLNAFDNLIAANQRKLDLLKKQKKGYLQKMFV